MMTGLRHSQDISPGMPMERRDPKAIAARITVAKPSKSVNAPVMLDISPPLHRDSEPDRHLSCQEALQSAFHEILAAACAAGWREREAAAALIELADNHLLAMCEVQKTSAIVVLIQRMTGFQRWPGRMKFPGPSCSVPGLDADPGVLGRSQNIDNGVGCIRPRSEEIGARRSLLLRTNPRRVGTLSPPRGCRLAACCKQKA